MPENEGEKTTIGAASRVNMAVLVIVVASVATGSVWAGKSLARFDYLETLVFQIRDDVRSLAGKVDRLPQK